MSEFADRLKSQTKQAIESQKTLKQLEEEKKIAADKARYAAEVARGEQMKSGIEAACSAAAALGKNKAKVAKLEKYGWGGKTIDVIPDNDQQRSGYERKHLSIAAAAAWDRIIELGLTPSVKWEHDGMGDKDWFELWASWEEKA